MDKLKERIALNRKRSSSSHEALQELHWLPVKCRIDYKISCLVYRCLSGTAPKYLSDLLKRKTFRRTTRSTTQAFNDLEVPRVFKATMASRAFSVYGPKLWNTLPVDLRSLDSYSSFKTHLKTFIFSKAF